MADYVRREVAPLLNDCDVNTLEIVVGALEVAVEAREFDEDDRSELGAGREPNCAVPSRFCTA